MAMQFLMAAFPVASLASGVHTDFYFLKGTGAPLDGMLIATALITVSRYLKKPNLGNEIFLNIKYIIGSRGRKTP